MRSDGNAQDRIYADCAKSLSATGVSKLDPLRGGHVMVTGASGFVGRWLLSMLAFLNDVHGFGVRATAIARRPARAFDRAAYLSGRDDLVWTASDVRQLVALPDGVEWLVHGAGIPDARHHATSPIETMSVIAEGTFRVLRLAEQATRLQKILHLSSGLVGNAHHHTAPTATYLEAKRFSETLCYAFRTQAKLPIVIARPFTLLGPFHDLESPWAANNFLHAALAGQPLKIRGDGQAIRSYLYGADMAVLALGQMVHGASGEVFDLGGIETMNIVDLARLIVRQADRPIDIRVNGGGTSAPVDRFVPDMRQSIERLGVMPGFSTLDAVIRSMSWYGG